MAIRCIEIEIVALLELVARNVFENQHMGEMPLESPGQVFLGFELILVVRQRFPHRRLYHRTR